MLEEPNPPSAGRSEPTQRTPRVAVIGVHGIAHHDPGATANAMADLLLSIPPYNPTKPDPLGKKYFSEFRSIGIQIPLKPILIDKKRRVDTVNDGVLHPLVKGIQEESAEFSRALVQENRARPEGQAEENVDLKFSRRLLQDYQGGAEGNAYITTRLEGARRSYPDKADVDVHIYEMFWADLARPTNSVVSFFLAVFQLVLHLPSLSRLAVDTHAATNNRWKAFQFAQRYAARVLQIIIPMLKIVLLVALFAAAPMVAKVRDLSMLAAGMLGILGITVCFLLSNRYYKPVYGKRLVWLVASFLPGLLLGVSTYVLIRWNYWKQEVVLAFVVWVLGAVLLQYAVKAYQNVSPGIARAAWFVYGIAALIFWVWAAIGKPIDHASLWATQWLIVFLRLSWLGLTILAIAAFFLGGLVWRTETERPRQAKARAAVRTSRLALALPAFLFLFTTGMIWAGLFSVANTIRGSKEEAYFDANLVHGDVAPWSNGLDRLRTFDLFPHREIGDNFRLCYHDCDMHPDYLKGVLAWSLGYGVWIVMLVAVLGLLVIMWWVLPSVLTERFPLREPWPPGQKIHTEPPRSSTNSESVWMGAWISRGLDATSFVTYWIWSAVFLIPIVFLFTGSWRHYFEDTTKLVICQAVTIAASAALLASLIRYSSPIIRCVLDVDTYLRAGPTDATPRAKIFERFASLLRFVEGQGYDSVVIVAHSLGSLISADLLRLLKELKNDKELSRLGFGPSAPTEPLRIKLFTMGNPLRQLLNRFFPYLYAWVREEPDNAMEELPRPALEKPPGIRSDALPNPLELGVIRWVNAYRSGDYVGRSLWTNEWYQRTETGDGLYPKAVHVVKESGDSPTRFEFCIGGGAHTHYWDDTAPDIAEQLNDLL
jgi:hypothetical protein